jgi:predicted PurR-regulated permease PerM
MTTAPASPNFRRFIVASAMLGAGVMGYLLRGVLLPLFFAFLLAYVLDPMVDRLEALRVPRWAGALTVMLGIVGIMTLVMVYAVPMFIDEIRAAAAELPDQLKALQGRAEPWLLANFHVKLPHTISELATDLGTQAPSMVSAASTAFFGTLSYVGVVLSAMIVPVFALYLLIDFDRIVRRTRQLIPRRWTISVTDVAAQIHRALGGYVRGQLTACIVLAALYAVGLRLVDIRLAVPIGVLTGMLAFVPYIGFGIGLSLALAMATLDWHGVGPIVGVAAVMGGVQILDGMVITPRIVGRSVGLAPLEVLITMMAAGSLFGFFGVLLAVPMGAVVKILIQRVVKVYLASDFYLQRNPDEPLTPPPPRPQKTVTESPSQPSLVASASSKGS